MFQLMLLIFLQIFSSASAQNSLNKTYLVALDSIILAEKSQKYVAEVYGSTEMHPFVSHELIPFDFLTLDVDIIRKIYINGFNPFPQREFTDEERMILIEVTDSLKGLNEYFNQGYSFEKNRKLSKLSRGRKNNIIVFFSKMQDNLLYAEVVLYNPIIHKDKKKRTVSYGTGLTFLFEFDTDDKIRKIFYGDVFYN